MSIFLILLAAGESKRLKSSVPKPYITVNNKKLLEHALNSFQYFRAIKKTVIVYNKKHKKHLNKLNPIFPPPIIRIFFAIFSSCPKAVSVLFN